VDGNTVTCNKFDEHYMIMIFHFINMTRRKVRLLFPLDEGSKAELMASHQNKCGDFNRLLDDSEDSENENKVGAFTMERRMTMQ